MHSFILVILLLDHCTAMAEIARDFKGKEICIEKSGTVDILGGVFILLFSVTKKCSCMFKSSK